MKRFQREITIHLLTPERMRMVREEIKNNAPTHHNDYILIDYKDGSRWLMDYKGCDEQPPTLVINKILTVNTWFVGESVDKGYGYAELYINPKLPQKQIDKIVTEELIDEDGNDCYDTVNLGREVLQNNDSGLWGLLGDTGKYGEQYTQFYHQPKKAIKFLRQKKSGECVAALHRDDIGDIDIIWGEVKDSIKHTGYGLAHIIDKHETKIKTLGFEIEDFIPIVVQFGDFNVEKSDSQKRVYESNNFRFVVAVEQMEDNKKHWLLTAFDL